MKEEKNAEAAPKYGMGGNVVAKVLFVCLQYNYNIVLVIVK